MSNLQSIYTSPDIRQVVDSTPLTWTAGLVAGAVSGTLSGTFAFATGNYIINFGNSIQGVNSEERTVTLTNGSNAVAWTQPLLRSTGPTINIQSISVASGNLSLSNAPVLYTSSNTTSGIVLAASRQRIGWSIQNQGTNVVQVCLGVGASTSQLHYTLKGCSVAGDGTGGSISFFSGAVYNGVVTVAGTSFSVSAVDLRSA